MSLSLQFLGTGTSVGVPQIGCSCQTCTSTDPRDRRRRTGAYVRTGKTAFLIDTPPEMRLAALELGITKVDAVVVTHCHMDHVAGFDDLRRFNTINGTPGPDGRVIGAPMPCFAAQETLDSLHRIFPYISVKANEQGLFRPMIDFTPVDGPFTIGDVTLTPLPVEHGPRTNGYLMECGGERFAYISDCAAIPEETLRLMLDIDVLVLDCLRARPHPTHLDLEQALGYVERIRPRRTWFVHMCHEVKHADFEASLPPDVRLAYDGLTVEGDCSLDSEAIRKDNDKHA